MADFIQFAGCIIVWCGDYTVLYYFFMPFLLFITEYLYKGH